MLAVVYCAHRRTMAPATANSEDWGHMRLSIRDYRQRAGSRSTPRRGALGLLSVFGVAGAMAAFGSPAALAGSGDFCSWASLSPGAACFGGYHGSFVELEGWNSDGKGVGSCVGVYNGGVKGENCVGDASGYDETYCTTSCAGKAGDGFVQDNSPYNSVFTGWASW